ncbi:capsule assembly Wzi family protein [Ekhidna sp. To15]|uniref:capsule assembly Wzi family protein n=1 Tax=Ekhidna sp. To15 TaxID=3395267 RepID=UPI003F525B65
MRLFIILLFIGAAAKLNGQVLFPGYHLNEYYEILRMKNPELADPITYHPSIINSYAADSALSWDLWNGQFDISNKGEDYIEVLDPFMKMGYISEVPNHYNDGAVWEGKGFNSSLNFGFTGRKGMLSFTFAPVVYYAQNQDFYIPSVPSTKSQFSYPFERRIDWVLRYGDQSVNRFNLGQSEIRLLYKKMTIGLSTQNMIWGPAQVSPVIMSNNAAGVPHLDIGTAKPIDTKFGKFEFKVFWGFMDESDYFDTDEANDKRYLTGAVFGFQPKFAEGLSLGINRVLYRDMFDGDFKPVDLFAAVWGQISNPDLPNDDYDQMLSLTVSWKFKEYGFETFLEFARNDYPGVIIDFFEQPDRTRGVTMGFVKSFDLKNGNLFRVVYEHTKLNKIKLSAVASGHAAYYVHGQVDNGYTNDGQIMGSYIGPGSNANHFKFQLYTPKGRIGFNIDRVRFNDDYLADNFTPAFNQPNDGSFLTGFDYLRFIKNFSVEASIYRTNRRNWYYEADRDVNNLSFTLKVGYTPGQNNR